MAGFPFPVSPFISSLGTGFTDQPDTVFAHQAQPPLHNLLFRILIFEPINFEVTKVRLNEREYSQARPMAVSTAVRAPGDRCVRSPLQK